MYPRYIHHFFIVPYHVFTRKLLSYFLFLLYQEFTAFSTIFISLELKA
nr:MAG TPA: hypothetical protein [Caudoviricetes sp.]